MLKKFCIEAAKKWRRDKFDFFLFMWITILFAAIILIILFMGVYGIVNAFAISIFLGTGIILGMVFLIIAPIIIVQIGKRLE